MYSIDTSYGLNPTGIMSLSAWDWARLILLAVLSWITVHRKELSSNQALRQQKQKGSKGTSRTLAAAANDTAMSLDRADKQDESDTEDDGRLLTSLASTIATEIYSESMTHAKAVTSHIYGSAGGDPTEGNHAHHRPRNYSTDGALIGPLSQDNVCHTFSFLTPREVCVCVSSLSRGLAVFARSDELWRVLYRSHFEEIIRWDVAQEAYKRSVGKGSEMNLHDHQPAGDCTFKEFYFLFSCSWLNWAIAGKCSETHCLVGLHGAVYDITGFLDDHPGSPETLLCQSGRDSTSHFEDIGHSMTARDMSNAMRVAGPSHGLPVKCRWFCGKNRTEMPSRAVAVEKLKTLSPSSSSRNSQGWDGQGLDSVVKSLAAGKAKKEAEVQTWKLTIGDETATVIAFYDPIQLCWSVWRVSPEEFFENAQFISGKLV